MTTNKKNIIDINALRLKQDENTKKPVWLSFNDNGNPKIDHVALADEIHNEIITYKNNIHYKYFSEEDGIWKDNAREFLISYIINKLGPFSKKSIIEETMFQHSGKFHLSNNHDPFENSDPYVVALKNGTINVKTGEFKNSFDPEDYIRTKHKNIKYNPGAECPKIEKMLTDLVGEEQLPFIYEWFGFQLIRTYQPQAFLFLLGKGGSGKSTLLDLLKYFVGIENITTNTLETLMNTQKTYPIAEMYGKSANICGDIDAKYMNSPGVFKSLTGNDVITGDRKFQKAIQFKNYAKMTFSMNDLPALSDFSEAMKRRSIILKIDRIIPKEEINFNLINEITTEDEISGLLNKTLIGIQRILDNKWFTITPSIQKEIDNWFEESDIVSQFLQEKCELREKEENDKKDFSFFTRADTLFARFDLYRQQANCKEMTKQTFFKRLKNLGYEKAKKKLTKEEQKFVAYKNFPESFQAVYDIKIIEPKNNNNYWY